MPNNISLRTDLREGDVEVIVRLHETLYTREFGFDASFLNHVSEPMRQFAATPSPRQCIWIAERDGHIVGSIAIVEDSEKVARLRWFLVEPAVRGLGLGRRLLGEALAFCQASGYDSVILWTVSLLTTAARLYRAAGFRKVVEQPGRMGGIDVIEEMYELNPIP